MMKAAASRAVPCLLLRGGRNKTTRSGGRHAPVLHKCFVSPSGLHPLFLPSEPWTMGFSKSFKKKFFYNKKTKDSTFDLPADSIAPFQ